MRSGKRFFTRPTDLEKLWTACGLTDEDTVRNVMEPTRNAWVPLASWFRHRGARVSIVPTTQSADLRAYYSKHAINDHLDSKMLAGCRCCTPRACVSSPVVFLRLDAQLQLLGPAWYDAFGSSYGKAMLALLTR